MSIEPTLSALRTLRYSSAKLADLITDGIADAEVRSQVREACLRELRWVDALVGGEAAAGVTLTDAEHQQATVVRLPATPDDCDISEGNGYESAILDVQAALDAAGVKWEMGGEA